jgi:hypothetical protein
VSTVQYERALAAAKRELAKLLKQRQEIDVRISRLEPTILHLESLQKRLREKAAVVSKTDYELTVGLTEAVRRTLQESHLALTAVEVGQRMEKHGFDLSKYSNPLASIHTVLKRLVTAGQVKVDLQPKNKKAYRWLTGLDHAMTLLKGIEELTKKVAK